MSDVVMYVKDGCPYCAAAIKHYSERGVDFQQVNIHRVPGAKEKVLELTGGTAIVPVIVEDGQIKKGFGGG